MPDLIDDGLDTLIARADLDGLVRLIDARCASHDWAGLLRLRDRSRAAVATGRQLWPAATLAEYRLALWAPADWATQVLDEEGGRFTIGPLTEVIAQRHTWAELAPLLPASPRAEFVAHERALRGEAIDATGLTAALDIPPTLQTWEPHYAVAEYSDDGIQAPTPALPTSFEAVRASPAAEVVDDPTVELAVRQLVEPWTTTSNGRVDVVCVEGSASEAIGALGLARWRIAALEPAPALAWLAWAGASGGAKGRRRGGAIGRFGAWWTVASLADLLDDWPVNPAVLGHAAAELDWYWWDSGEPTTGWELQLAVADRSQGCAWAISAHDAD